MGNLAADAYCWLLIFKGVDLKGLFPKLFVSILFLLTVLPGFSQSMSHPVIWATAEERPRVLKLIEEYEWARSLSDGLHQIVDEKVRLHEYNPSWILRKIPVISPDDNLEELEVETVHKHARVLAYASYAGLLYYLTEEPRYAQFAADILWYYTEELAPRDPGTTSICGNTFYDPRTSYSQFAIAYDFIFNYLRQPGRKVYSQSSNTAIDYDHNLMQRAIINMVGNVLQEYGHPDEHGKFISNHPILTAPGALFSILCVEDDRERERLFHVFWEQGTAHQNSFKNTILPMFGDQGIWPESTSYSFMANITMILNIVDRIKPEMDVMDGNMHILDGNFLFDNLRLPDRRFVSYGDTHRENDPTALLYRYTLDLAKRRDFTEYVQRAKVALRQAYDSKGGYSPKVEIETFGNYDAFTELLWGHPIPDTISAKIDFKKPTVIIEHAGVALQRNYVEENNELYGLCGVIGGAHYVHSHVTGISMELYGAGYVMGPSAGLPESVALRRIPLHEHYFRLYAGNNTVVVNGASHGRNEGSWKGRANVWQNAAVNIAAEPKHLADPINKNFSFATQLLKDEVNNAEQQRTLSVIRTSPKTGYYFDMFRSKSLGENRFHDYIYHNLGDETTLETTLGKKPALKKTKRYNNDIGDVVHSPGWRYFEHPRVTNPTEKAMKARFHIKVGNKYMHQFMPGGEMRDYAKVLAPASRDVRNGYTDKKTQVVVIRQEGEAWDKPFVVVYEPSGEKSSSVRGVENLYSGDRIVGAKVTSQVQEKQIVDYIINQDASGEEFSLPEEDLFFKGRFAIVRSTVENGKTSVELYVGEGESLRYQGKVWDGSPVNMGQ